MNNQKTKRISLDFPIDLAEKINKSATEGSISKKKWFINAAEEKLRNEINKKVDKIVRG